MVKIELSILAADFSKLGYEVKKAERAGADLIHIDVMDGHFVPNMGIGSFIIKDLREKTRLPFNVHLMVEKPEQWVEPYANAGGDIITVHIETRSNLQRTIQAIKSLRKKVGIAINPPTPIRMIEPILEELDMVLVMSVNPGFSGQTFISNVLPKIKEAREMIDDRRLRIDLAVDGGINGETARQVWIDGADILVVGSGVFHKRNIKKAIEELKRMCELR